MSAMNPRDVMLVVSSCVNRAIDQAFDIFEPRRADFFLFLKGLQHDTQIRHLLTTDGLENVRNMLADETKRDFILTLDTMVHANIADRYILYKALLENLNAVMSHRGFAVDGVSDKAEFNLLPQAYVERMPSSKDIAMYFENNKILVTIACVCLWGKIPYTLTVTGNKTTITRIPVTDKEAGVPK